MKVVLLLLGRTTFQFNPMGMFIVVPFQTKSMSMTKDTAGHAPCKIEGKQYTFYHNENGG